ncbi:hypothetical protein MPSEU_000152500 [Mayamaea pseudoterrestris]|nr:hypothetical protein MPSEU_000152500 [Mayamaea pseudoterrestris]
MSISDVSGMISTLVGSILSPDPSLSTPFTAKAFNPTHELSETDATLIAMLNSPGHESVAYCVCDPSKQDLPIIFSSDGFCKLTGYSSTEIEGRNCRFLQGDETNKNDIERIRKAIQNQESVEVNLLNYRKDGTPFANEFFLSPLRNEANKTVYFIGVQCPVQALGPGQAPHNAAWIYTQGNHA